MPRSKRVKKPEEEALNAMINMDGKGEDPAVQAMLSDEFVTGPNASAVEIALALQQIVRGQAAMLENQEKFSEHLDRLRQRMDEMDKAAERWETDREKFIQEVLDKAANLKATGSAKDQIQAKGGNLFTEEVMKARAAQTIELQQFEDALKKMPKVTVVSAGELVMVVENGRQVAKIMDETVKIKTHKWTLPAGQAVEVPLVVKQVLDQRRRLQEETAAREKLLAANVETGALSQEWSKINSKFNSTTDTVPGA